MPGKEGLLPHCSVVPANDFVHPPTWFGAGVGALRMNLLINQCRFRTRGEAKRGRDKSGAIPLFGPGTKGQSSLAHRLCKRPGWGVQNPCGPVGAHGALFPAAETGLLFGVGGRVPFPPVGIRRASL